MATNVTPIQVLRSEVSNKRPDPAKMLAGQPAVNTNAGQPGFFFADSTGNTLFKVGPCSVGSLPPNSGATGQPGQLGNTLGELWLDLNDTPLLPGPALRVWDGTQWLDCMPNRQAVAFVSDTTPNVGDHQDGQLWWDSGTGLLYILYNDGVSRTWTQVSGNTVP